MSTGLDCRFEEHADGWRLYLESWAHRDEYDEYGPFSSLEQAKAYLDRNHANPGGYCVLSRDTTLDMEGTAEALRAALDETWTVEIIDERMDRFVRATSAETIHVPQFYSNVPAADVPVREIVVYPPSTQEHAGQRFPNGSAVVTVRMKVAGSREPTQRSERFALVSETYPGMGEVASIEEAIERAVAWDPPPPSRTRRQMW